MKKLLALTLALVMTLSLAACGGSGNPPVSKANNVSGSSNTPARQEQSQNTPEPAQNNDEGDVEPADNGDIDTDTDPVEVTTGGETEPAENTEISNNEDKEDSEDKTDSAEYGPNYITEEYKSVDDPDWVYFNGWYVYKNTWKFNGGIDWDAEQDPNIDSTSDYMFMNYLTPIDYEDNELTLLYHKLESKDSKEEYQKLWDEYVKDIREKVLSYGELEENTVEYEQSSGCSNQFINYKREGNIDSIIFTIGSTFWDRHTYNYNETIRVQGEATVEDLLPTAERAYKYTGIKISKSDVEKAMNIVRENVSLHGSGDTYATIIDDPVNELRLTISGVFVVDGEESWVIDAVKNLEGSMLG